MLIEYYIYTYIKKYMCSCCICVLIFKIMVCCLVHVPRPCLLAPMLQGSHTKNGWQDKTLSTIAV